MATRDNILECARDIYLADGLRGMSLRAVARCAGISAPAIYKHFDSKEALLLEVAMTGHRRFAAYLARGLRGTTAKERLMRTCMAYLDFAMEQRAFYMVMFVAPPEHLGFERLEQANANEGAITFQMLVDRITECIGSNLLAPGDPVAHALTVWAHVHGLVTLLFRVPADPELAMLAPPPVRTPEAARSFYEGSVSALLRGMAPVPP